ncbi:MAG TPA: hypothetical protein VFP55_11380 [Solirubrobacteraceae bacterium]|nr:hypothetical protein [Solirubrobacteraceae bacterium]
MSDDWRLRVTVGGRGEAEELAEQLKHGRLEHGMASGAVDRVIVSVDDREVFLYADGREQLDRARQAIETLAGSRRWSVESRLSRWHPVAEEWEDPDAPLPADESGLAAEYAERIAEEREESRELTRELGAPEWEVRIECRSHRDTVALSERLEGEGLRPVRRWRYLLVGAVDEDSARQLADRLTGEATPGCTITVEGSGAAVAAETPPNPFAVFGGLGG